MVRSVYPGQEMLLPPSRIRNGILGYYDPSHVRNFGSAERLYLECIDEQRDHAAVLSGEGTGRVTASDHAYSMLCYKALAVAATRLKQFLSNEAARYLPIRDDFDIDAAMAVNPARDRRAAVLKRTSDYFDRVAAAKRSRVGAGGVLAAYVGERGPVPAVRIPVAKRPRVDVPVGALKAPRVTMPVHKRRRDGGPVGAVKAPRITVPRRERRGVKRAREADVGGRKRARKQAVPVRRGDAGRTVESLFHNKRRREDTPSPGDNKRPYGAGRTALPEDDVMVDDVYADRTLYGPGGVYF